MPDPNSKTQRKVSPVDAFLVGVTIGVFIGALATALAIQLARNWR